MGNLASSQKGIESLGFSVAYTTVVPLGMPESALEVIGWINPMTAAIIEVYNAIDFILIDFTIAR